MQPRAARFKALASTYKCPVELDLPRGEAQAAVVDVGAAGAVPMTVDVKYTRSTQLPMLSTMPMAGIQLVGTTWSTLGSASTAMMPVMMLNQTVLLSNHAFIDFLVT